MLRFPFQFRGAKGDATKVGPNDREFLAAFGGVRGLANQQTHLSGRIPVLCEWNSGFPFSRVLILV